MNVKQTLGVGLVSACIATLGSTAVAGPVAHEAGPNIVTNGSFENTATVAGSGWTPSGFISEGFDYFIDSNAADAQSGTRSFAGGGETNRHRFGWIDLSGDEEINQGDHF